MKITARQRLLASTLLMGIVAYGSPASAQDTPIQDPNSPQAPSTQVGDRAIDKCIENPNAPDCASEGQAIVVTGSRIASPTITSASPLQIVDARDIQESGVVNLQEVLLENPAFGTPAISRTNSAFSTSGAGVATIDLRNLGTSRTLVLVNGRRTVAGLPGGSTVDLNTIPAPFIERVDILTGGASSIYGSDAVAGVVNIVYRRNFEGLQLSGQAGISEEGDDARQQLNMMVGSNFDDERGNVTAYLGYTKEKGVYSARRPGSNIDNNACYQVPNSQGGCLTDVVTNRDFTRLFETYAPFLSGFAPNSVVTFGSTTRQVGPGGQLIVPNTNGVVGGQPSIENATGFNRNAFRTIALPIERYLLAFRGNYEMSENINAFMEGNFAKSQTTTLIEPFAFQSSGVNGVAPNACSTPITLTPQAICGGFIPIQTRVGTTIVRNPFVPDAIFNGATDRTGDGLRDISFLRRLTDFGPRTYTADRQTFRLLAGLEGDIFRDWKWDVFYGFGQTVESQVGSGQVNLNNFRSALEVIPGPNGPVCADPVARTQGCVPANIFAGAGQGFSPGAVTYIQATQTRNVRVEQNLAGANISGNLFELWDGPLGIAAGVEYRKEKSRAENDPLTTAGLNGGNALQPTAGQFDVKEAYGEIAVPLLANRPFFENLTVRAAARISDYSSIGTVYSWNYGAEYAPHPDIRMRAVWARATRAPNINELFGGRSQTFPTGLQDPCVGVTLTSTTAVSANCRAAPGVLQNIQTNGSFTLNQSDLQGVSGFGSGNPNLFEEKGDTFTAGVVINPRSIDALRNFVFTADYFNIRIRDTIAARPRQDILTQCFTVNEPVACALITRRPNPEGPNSAGSLQFIDTFPANSGAFNHQGFDLTMSYRQRLSDLGLGSGTLSGKIAYTHLMKFDFFSAPDAVYNPIDGEIGAAKDRASASISYDDRQFGATLRGTYIGRSYLDNTFFSLLLPPQAADAPLLEAGDEGTRPFAVKAYFTLDSQVRFTPAERYEFYVGVDNLLNRDTPPIISGLPGNSTGTQTEAGTYDPIGRRFYAGARLKF